jgi:hypothetical protein
VERLTDDLAAAYLELLGVDVRPGEVDADVLAALQRAHVERVPYETLDIVRGSPPGIDRLACAHRVLAERGGYCYHLNGAFSLLLEWLRVDVTRHLAGVQGSDIVEPPGANGNHLGLTVRMPDGARWLVDVGLGTGPAAPIPLNEGVYEQDGFCYELHASPLAPGGWRFEHDPRCGWIRFDMAPEPATTADFLAMHADLSTGRFARVVTAQRHVGRRIEILRGCVYTEVDGVVRARDVNGPGEWWELVLDHFGIAYDHLTAEDREELWRHVHATHVAWEDAGRP